MRLATLLATILCSLGTAEAVDVVGDPPEYLEFQMRPAWRLKAIGDVLDDISETIEKPVSRSRGIGLTFTEDIILIEEERSTVREVLELLERTQDLHFTAEPLRLDAMTGTEYRRKQRRLVNLDLRDYGLFFQPTDNFGRHVGRISEGNDGYDDDGGSPFGYDDEDADADQLLDDVLATLQLLDVEGTDTDVRSTGNIMVLATPKEEQRIRTTLEQLLALSTTRSSWEVHFGFVPEGIDVETGVQTTAKVKALADRLQDKTTLSLSAMSGQWVSSASRSKRTGVMDAEVNQTGAHPVLNPVTGGIASGQTVEVRPIVGIHHTLFMFKAGWSYGEKRKFERVVQVPPTSVSGSFSGSGTINRSDQKKNANDRTTSSGTVKPPTVQPPTRIPISIPAVWKWAPEGEVYLPTGHGLVLLGERNGQTLVLLFEEVK